MNAHFAMVEFEAIFTQEQDGWVGLVMVNGCFYTNVRRETKQQCQADTTAKINDLAARGNLPKSEISIRIPAI